MARGRDHALVGVLYDLVEDARARRVDLRGERAQRVYDGLLVLVPAASRASSEQRKEGLEIS